jgi:hypothetical protein
MRFGGKDDEDPVAFSVEAEIIDEFVDGSRRRVGDSALLHLPDTITIGADGSVAPLRLAVQFKFADIGAVRRRVEMRVDILPGFVGSRADRAPVRRVTLATARLVQWQRGYLPIQQQPLVTLQEAMKIGDAKHFPHVRLAAEFAPAVDRAKVLNLLIDWVRLGKPDQAQVAMATLTAIGAANIQLGDRDGWLAWWQGRR